MNRVALALGVFMAGTAFGIGVGYALFKTPPQEPPLAMEPATNQTTPPSGLRVATPEPQLHAASAHSASALAAPAPAPAPSDLRTRGDYDRAALDEVKGKNPIDSPPGLPDRFSDAHAIHDALKQRLAGTKLAAVEPIVNCDEYPCYATIAGLGPEDTSSLGDLPAPFAGDKTTILTRSANVDGGVAWTAAIAILPGQEPQARVSAVTARLLTRFTGQAFP